MQLDLTLLLKELYVISFYTYLALKYIISRKCLHELRITIQKVKKPNILLSIRFDQFWPFFKYLMLEIPFDLKDYVNTKNKLLMYLLYTRSEKICFQSFGIMTRTVKDETEKTWPHINFQLGTKYCQIQLKYFITWVQIS